MGFGAIAKPKTAKEVKTYRDKKLKAATKAGKVTAKQVQALSQAAKSERAGHKMVKEKPPKMKPVIKRVAERLFPKVAASTKKKKKAIKQAGGK